MKNNSVQIEYFRGSLLRCLTLFIDDVDILSDVQWFDKLINNKIFIDGILLASPDLYKSITEGDNSISVRDSVLRYFSRAIIRSTGYFGVTRFFSKFGAIFKVDRRT